MLNVNAIKQPILFISFLLCIGFNISGQNVDSLNQIVNFAQDDSVKVKALNRLSSIYSNDGNYPLALQHAKQAQKLSEKLSYKSGLFKSLLNTGRIYIKKGDYADAQNYYLQSLKLAEQIKDQKGKADVFNELGSFYESQGDNDKAMDEYNLSLKIRIELNDKKGIAGCYTNLGTIFANQGNSAKAIFSYTKSLLISTEIDDKEEMALAYNNIGTVYNENKDYQNALDYFLKSLAIHESLGSTDNIASCYINIGDVYRLQNKFSLADKYLKKGIQLCELIGSKEYTAEGYRLYYLLDSLKGDYKSVFDKYKKYILYRDSLENAEISKKTTEAQMNFDFDKKEAEAKAEQEKKDAIASAESRRQLLILWLIGIAGAGVTVVAFLVYRSLRQNKKTQIIIETQKAEVEQKNILIEHKQKEIVDSITYAQRIQNAILPPLNDVHNALPDSFVLFKPKDIVSGDFFWFAQKENKILIAAADCTGHGVPGAIMSMLCSDKLNESVIHSADISTILQSVNVGLKKALRQSDKADSTRDGMDIALCSFNKEMTYVEYAAANRPLWIIRNGKNDVEETKATKTAIGGFTEDDQIFAKHRLELQKGDTIYIFTDGYADQFSADDKKLMTKKFKTNLLEIQGKAMYEQKEFLDTFIEKWKDGTEQTDDILVIGIRV